MKKYFLMAVAGMLALSSCSNDNNDELNVENAPRKMTFTAGFGDAALTRATLDTSTKKVSFSESDGISIFSANNTSQVNFTTYAGGASATFEGTAVPGDPVYYAIYPNNNDMTFDSSTGIISGVTIPACQNNAATSDCGWDFWAPVAYATTTGTNLQFHNLCALLKVTNDKDFTVNICISDISEGSVKLTGTFDLNVSTGALTATEGNSSVMVDGVPAGKTIYIAVAPCTTSDFFVAEWSKDFETRGSKIKSTPSTFEAGKIYNLGNVSAWTLQ